MKERCGREWPQRSFWCSLGEKGGGNSNPKQLNNQQRGSHRRLGNAHGARDDLVEASCVSFASVQARKLNHYAASPLPTKPSGFAGSPRRASEKNAPWAALADCIMPPNLFGHTMSGHKWGPHEVAYFVGKGETNGAIELSHLRGSERYGVCFDARQAAVAGLKAAKAPSMSCESCQALSALLPIAGARAANTA